MYQENYFWTERSRILLKDQFVQQQICSCNLLVPIHGTPSSLQHCAPRQPQPKVLAQRSPGHFLSTKQNLFPTYASSNNPPFLPTFLYYNIFFCLRKKKIRTSKLSLFLLADVYPFFEDLALRWLQGG